MCSAWLHRWSRPDGRYFVWAWFHWHYLIETIQKFVQVGAMKIETVTSGLVKSCWQCLPFAQPSLSIGMVAGNVMMDMAYVHCSDPLDEGGPSGSILANTCLEGITKRWLQHDVAWGPDTTVAGCICDEANRSNRNVKYEVDDLNASLQRTDEIAEHINQ